MKRVYSPGKVYSQPQYVSGHNPTGFLHEDEDYDFLYKRGKKQKGLIDSSNSGKTRQEQLQYEIKAYNDQVQKVMYLDYDYPLQPDLMPFIFFYKFLAKRPEYCKRDLTKFAKLELWVPDTVVYNDSDGPFWIYTNQEGVVCRTENFTEKNVVSKLGNQYQIDELVAVCKTIDNAEGTTVGNKCQLMSTRDLAQKMSQTNSGNTDPTVIQKFIKCRGPNAFKYRAVWRKNKPPSCFVITNKTSFHDKRASLDENDKHITNIKKQLACSIVNQKGGKLSEECVEQVDKIVKFLEKYTGIQFEEMVCDFIRDESGLWWFIGCRAFKQMPQFKVEKSCLKYFLPDGAIYKEESESDDPDNPKKGGVEYKKDKSDYTKLRMCRFCQIGHPVSELSHQMTLLMILKTEKTIKEQQLNKDGNGNQFFEWLNHGEAAMFDQVMLYQPHRVCKMCFNIFKEIEQLKKVEKQFAKALGIPIEQHEPKQESNIKIKLQTSDENEMDPLEVLKMKKDQEIENLSIKKLYRFRIMLTFHEITNFDFQLPGIKKNQLSLEYSLLNITKSYKLNFANSESYNYELLGEEKPSININKIRLYYFFTRDKQAYLKFIKEEKVRVRLLYQGHELASAHYSLLEFRSPYVIKIGLNSLLCGLQNDSCYLKFYIGMTGTESEVDVSEVKIKNYNEQVFLPPENYYACEVLPEDWIDIIPVPESAKPSVNIFSTFNTKEFSNYDKSPSGKSLTKNSARSLQQSPTRSPFKQVTQFQKYEDQYNTINENEVEKSAKNTFKKKLTKTKSTTISKTLRNSNSTNIQLVSFGAATNAGQTLKTSNFKSHSNLKALISPTNHKASAPKTIRIKNIKLNPKQLQRIQSELVIAIKKKNTLTSNNQVSEEERLLKRKLKEKMEEINGMNFGHKQANRIEFFEF